jgi:hypothetical protein
VLKKALLLFEGQSDERISRFFLKVRISYWSLESQPTNFLFLVINYLFVLSYLEYYLSSEYRGKIIAAFNINIFDIYFVKITVQNSFCDLIAVQAYSCDSRFQLVY